MRVLIVGAGPAGLTLAASLIARGIAPVVIERAPAARRQGYAVDLHANGLDVADRIGILEVLKAAAMPLGDAVYCNRAGREIYRFGYDRMTRAAGGKLLVIMRDALVSVLLHQLESRCDIRYGTTVDGIAARDDDARCGAQGGTFVRFSDGTSSEFDLVVGADGIHSRVQSLMFGPEDRFIRHLGYGAAAWRMPWTESFNATFVTHVDVNRYAAFYRSAPGEIAALLCWRKPAGAPQEDAATPAEIPRLFAGWNDAVSAVINAVGDWRDVYGDDVSQTVMPRWSKDRVVLIGDAAHCMTLVSGQGTSMAMAGAYILAEELTRTPLAGALQRYERRLKPTIEKLQAAARLNAVRFLPATRAGLALRSLLLPILFSEPLIRRTMCSALPASLVAERSFNTD